MPKFAAEAAGSFASTFAFTGVDLDTLGASEYTVIGIAVDGSGSVAPFEQLEEAAIKAILEACLLSPRADNLLSRYTVFNSRVREVHGFKALHDCNAGDYDGSIRAGGGTALYDAAVDAVDAVARQGVALRAKDFACNGIVFVITDGDNAGGTMTLGEVKKSVERVKQAEGLESLLTILVGVNVSDPHMAVRLKEFADQSGFSDFIDMGKADAKSFARLTNWASQQISSQSQSLGTGGPSKVLTF